MRKLSCKVPPLLQNKKSQPSVSKANCYRFFTLGEVIEGDDFHDSGLKLGSYLTLGPLSQKQPSSESSQGFFSLTIELSLK
jgi:hypothetical protein